MGLDDSMPLQDPFPSLEVGPFYCSYEDDRSDGPEFIVDPLSGFVVAMVPPRRCPARASDGQQRLILVSPAARDLTRVIARYAHWRRPRPWSF